MPQVVASVQPEQLVSAQLLLMVMFLAFDGESADRQAQPQATSPGAQLASQVAVS